MERIGKAFDLPLLVNVVEGGKTPVLSAEEYIGLGYQMAIYPALAFLALGKAVEDVYGHLKTTGYSVGTQDRLADFMTFSSTMGFEDIWAFERDHAGLEEAAE